jgi:hypothetical protein
MIPLFALDKIINVYIMPETAAHWLSMKGASLGQSHLTEDDRRK